MKKIFNLDLHISVIADIKNILSDIRQDIEVTDWSISGHTWVFNRKQTKVEFINQHTWKNINPTMIKLFNLKYNKFLKQFDAFIVTHTPVFCLLFRIYNKPIFLINSCRYEQPFCWNKDLQGWSFLNKELFKMWKSGQLIAISNNKADKNYLKLGTNIDSIHLPSLCLYTNTSYIGNINKILIDGKYPPEYLQLPNIYDKKKILNYKYTFKDLYRYKAIIVFPYEASTMTIFELYSANIPLFFPSKKYLKFLIKNNYSFQSRYANLYPKNMDLAFGNNWINFWLDNADYYDLENMNYIIYFDNIKDLYYKILHTDYKDISLKIKEWNIKRQLKVKNSYKKLYNII